jgi:sugar O-acyltransferase (sialic acid O-acetyltransferase NeuD family)
MENPVIIIGANTIGREAQEIFEKNGNVVYGFLDDDSKLHGSLIHEVTVLGSPEDDKFLSLVGKKCEAFIALDDNRLRKALVRTLNEKRKVQPVNAVHPSAQVASSASLGHGTFIGAGAIISPGAELGQHCLIHAGSLIGTSGRVGDYVQVGHGARVNPGVTLESECFIGSGSVIVSGVTIGRGARVGAGSVVIASVAAGQTVFGNPAAAVKA